jgi:hypothetical protein
MESPSIHRILLPYVMHSQAQHMAGPSRTLQVRLREKYTHSLTGDDCAILYGRRGLYWETARLGK